MTATALQHPSSQASKHRPSRILMIAEDVTLAHLGRMVTLAEALAAPEYEVTIASSGRYSDLIEPTSFRHVEVATQSPDQFRSRLEAGTPLRTKAELRESVENDLELYRRTNPDLVVGDFRGSLSTSAEIAGLPHINVCNGYWSPRTTLDFPIPDHPMVRRIGLSATRALAHLVIPVSLRAHLRPYNHLRASFGLSRYSDLNDAYTRATRTLYADLPSIAPVHTLPRGHSYLGPVLWEPKLPVPSWWDEVSDQRPLVYLNVGSSGADGILDAVAEALADLPLTVIAATVDRSAKLQLPENFHSAPYLPGTAAAARARLVICNGGSGSVYQALSSGVPILGIPSNPDQHLSMQGVVSAGAGLVVRSDQLTPAAVRKAALRLLEDTRFTESARLCGEEISGANTAATFVDAVEGLLAASQTRTSLATS